MTSEAQIDTSNQVWLSESLVSCLSVTSITGMMVAKFGVEREKKSVTCLRIWCRRECMSDLHSESLSQNKLEMENVCGSKLVPVCELTFRTSHSCSAIFHSVALSSNGCNSRSRSVLTESMAL